MLIDETLLGLVFSRGPQELRSFVFHMPLSYHSLHIPESAFPGWVKGDSEANINLTFYWHIEREVFYLRWSSLHVNSENYQIYFFKDRSRMPKDKWLFELRCALNECVRSRDLTPNRGGPYLKSRDKLKHLNQTVSVGLLDLLKEVSDEPV